MSSVQTAGVHVASGIPAPALRPTLPLGGHGAAASTSHALVLRTTLLLLLFFGGSEWNVEAPLRLLCGVALLDRRLLSSRVVWGGLTAALAFHCALNWYTVDNHKYLITYWVAVCALSVASDDPDRVLAVNARLLIGLCFAFATAWKVHGGEFGDGSFLHYKFLTDGRLEPYLPLAAGLGPQAIETNRLLLDSVQATEMEEVLVPLSSTTRLRTLTLWMSWWTILIEGAVALAFLWPRADRLAAARDWLLIAFVATTYFLLPVLGFAFLLTLMGFAQCDPGRSMTRKAYFATLVLVLAMGTPLAPTLVGLWR